MPSSSTSRKKRSRGKGEAEEQQHAPAATNTTRRQKRRRKSSKSANRPTTPVRQLPVSGLGSEADSQTRYFKPSKFVIMNEAHRMLRRLVFEEGPYREKLIELAKVGIHFVVQKLGRNPDPDRLTPDQVIASAFDSMTCYWARQKDPRLEGEAAAFMSLGQHKTEGGAIHRFPIFGIRQLFLKNDFLNDDELSESQRNGILISKVGKMTLLLLFRKAKHEFTRIVHRCPAIKYLLDMDEGSIINEVRTPDKYIPCFQKDPMKNDPEVGDHDEEEDSGGSILPCYYNAELSGRNPVCVQFRGQMRQLDQTQIDGLLKIDLYFRRIKGRDGRNTTHTAEVSGWTFRESRAFVDRILDEAFFTTEQRNRSGRRNNSSTVATSRTGSPAVSRTPKTPNGNGNVAAWRRPENHPIIYTGNDPEILRSAFKISSEKIVSRSPTPDP